MAETPNGLRFRTIRLVERALAERSTREHYDHDVGVRSAVRAGLVKHSLGMFDQSQQPVQQVDAQPSSSRLDVVEQCGSLRSDPTAAFLDYTVAILSPLC